MGDKPKSLPTIRTFAHDLEHTRTSSGISTKSHKSPTVQTPDHKAAPAHKHANKKETVAAHHKTQSSKATTKQPTQSQNHHVKENPPYHALKRKVPPPPTVDVSEINSHILEDRPSSVLASTTKHVSLTDDGGEIEATIISDTKRKRFSLTAALSDSLTNWWQDIKARYIDKQKPKYTVPAAERRKGVIQQATSKTGRTSAADHAVVVERIRNKKHAAMHVETDPAHLLEAPDDQPQRTSIQNVTILPRKTARNAAWSNEDTSTPKELSKETITTPEPESTWTPSEETQPKVAIPPTPPSPHVDNTPPIDEPEETIRASQPAPTKPIAPQIPPPVPAAPPVTPATKDSERVTPVTPPEALPKTPHASIPKSITPTIPTTPVAPAASTPPPHTMSPTPQTQTFFSRYTFRDTNTMVLAIVGGVVCLATAYVAVSALMGILMQPQDTVMQYQPPAIFTMSSQLVSPEPPSFTNILSSLQSGAMISDTPIRELTFVNSTSDGAISGRANLEFLPNELPNAFLESVRTVTWGTYRESYFIALTVTDTTNARGALLAWEESLVPDLRPLLQTNANQIRFSDDTIANIDVRIARDADDNEVLIYGFLTDSLIIIADTSTTFLNLSQSYR